jgi:hypothetical protein
VTTPTDGPGNNDGPPPTNGPSGSSGDGPGTGPRPIDIPSFFRGYEVTYFSSLGRAQLAGADDQTLRDMRDAMYDGWMRPNRYDEHGNETFGYRERREARQDYERMADMLEEGHAARNDQDVNAAFDWDAWREEYEEAQAS